MPHPESLSTFIDQARANLALRMELDDPAAIEVVEARYVTWPNGALGCPEPDMMYTQALVRGYRIMLRTGGETYAYHGSRDQPPFYCPARRAETPMPDGDAEI
ncbi:MAG: hypothetical protein ACPGJE_09910 [Wenzhouxiangellaceae bacterium]